MSDFECRHGHLMRPGDKECAQCAAEGRPGQRIFYMDGMTSSQLRRQEEWEEAHRYDEEFDEEDESKLGD